MPLLIRLVVTEYMPSYGKNIVHLFLYVVILTAFAFLGSITLHELGHATTGVAAGCDDIRIVALDLGERTTFTRMSCPHSANTALLAAGSFLLVTPFALLLLSLTGFAERHLGWVMLGGHLLGSIADLGTLIADTAVYTAMIAGVLLIIYGEHRFIGDRFQQELPPLQKTLPSENVDIRQKRIN